MGVDTKLFLNHTVRLEEIRETLKHKLNLETKVLNSHTPEYVILTFVSKKVKYEGRSLNIHLNSLVAGFSGTLLTMRSNDVGLEILSCIAETFGGFHCPEDVEDNYNVFNGNMDTGNGIPYFLRTSLINGGNPSDLNELKKHIKKWEKTIGPSSIKGLK